MLKLAMLKRFCLKKKKFLVLSDFAPQAVSSVENCVCSSWWPERNQMQDLRHISRSRRLYLQMWGNIFLSQQNSILVKDEFGYLFLFFFPWETRGYNVNS